MDELEAPWPYMILYNPVFKNTQLFTSMAKAIQHIKLFTPDERIINKIYLLRGQKVMPDEDLAESYGVETKQLKRQVRRNTDRFPEDFMFELKAGEYENLRSQFGTSSWVGFRYMPMVLPGRGCRCYRVY